MKIACDNQVSLKLVEHLRTIGYDVVMWASDRMDRWWFMDALDLGAQVFISPDWDIGILCNQYDVEWLKIPPYKNSHEVRAHILNKLKILKGTLKFEQATYT